MKKRILVTSFGTSHGETRDRNIGALEEAAQKAFPDYEVRRAFTSNFIIRKLRKEGLFFDSVREGIERAREEGVRELVVAVTHLLDGEEYQKVVECVRDYETAFSSLKLSLPLLSSEEDIDILLHLFRHRYEADEGGRTAMVFMGHGSDSRANEIYHQIGRLFKERGMEDYYIATVEATPRLEEVLELLRKKSYSRVILQALMIVAGDHACNDMAGPEEDSWRSILEREGYEVSCLLEGLGEQGEIQGLFVDHIHRVL